MARIALIPSKAAELSRLKDNCRHQNVGGAPRRHVLDFVLALAEYCAEIDRAGTRLNSANEDLEAKDSNESGGVGNPGFPRV